MGGLSPSYATPPEAAAAAQIGCQLVVEAILQYLDREEGKT